MTTRENVFLGDSANDLSGDTLRAGGTKINQNFGKLFNMLGPDSDHLSERISFDSDGIIHTGPTYTSTIRFTDASANRIVWIPDTNGTFVMDSADQIIANKTLRNVLLVDSSDNTYLDFFSDSAPVNHFRIENAASGNFPELKIIGSDTNINMNVSAKGNGSVQVNKLATNHEVLESDGAINLDVGYTIFNSAVALSMTLTNGSTTGERKLLSNRGAGTVTVTPASFGQGTSFAMATTAACELVWDSADWYIFSAFNDSDITVT